MAAGGMLSGAHTHKAPGLMSGGRRRRGGRTRRVRRGGRTHRRGGMHCEGKSKSKKGGRTRRRGGSVVGHGLLPFGLLGIQKWFQNL
tara:strand:- start:17370 stop:17630 length:261 start_codon:yes stop_codon:yes gene_type:complete